MYLITLLRHFPNLKQMLAHYISTSKLDNSRSTSDSNSYIIIKSSLMEEIIEIKPNKERKVFLTFSIIFFIINFYYLINRSIIFKLSSYIPFNFICIFFRIKIYFIIIFVETGVTFLVCFIL